MPTTIKKSKKKESKVPALLLMFAAVLVIGGALFLVVNKFRSFQPHTDTYGPFTHKVGDAPFVPPAEIWSDANITRYNDQGVGLAIPFVKTHRNGQSVTRNYELPGWKRYQEEQDNEKRRKIVREARKRFDETVAWLNGREAVPVKAIWVTDVTGGISQSEHAMIADRLDQAGLKQSLSAGDPVSFRGCIISDSRFENCQKLSAKAGETGKAGELQTILDWVSLQRPPTNDTSLYQGLANILASAGADRPEDLYFFTDGVENDNELGISFYKTPERVVPERYEELLKAIEARKPLPSMAGIRVHLYGPRRGVGKERVLIDRSLDFAAWVFTQKGAASVEKYYE